MSERILIRSVNWLGDAVMTMPAIQRLREARPDAHLSLLTHAKLAELWALHPALDSVISFAPGEKIRVVAARLRAGNYDTAIAFPNSLRSALELWWARIPRRIGHARLDRNAFLTRLVKALPSQIRMRKRSQGEINELIRCPDAARTTFHSSAHQSHHYLHLVSELGADPTPVTPQINVPVEDIQKVRATWVLEHDEKPWFGLNAGAEYGPAKRYPPELYAEALVELTNRINCRWVLLGGPGDADTGRAVMQQVRQRTTVEIINLAGQTSLRELCAVLKVCSVVLTNDSGPMHVAAAVGTPVVAPFGSTAPELTGPGLAGDPTHTVLTADVPCAPCFLRKCPIDFRCMRRIEPGTLVEAAVQAYRRLDARREYSS